MDLELLVLRIRRGDKSALRELISMCGGDVYKKAYERTKDAELAREATRQTFAQFVVNLQEKPEADGWRLYLDTLAQHNIQSYSRIPQSIENVGMQLERELFEEPEQQKRIAEKAVSFEETQPDSHLDPEGFSPVQPVVRPKGDPDSNRADSLQHPTRASGNQPAARAHDGNGQHHVQHRKHAGAKVSAKRKKAKRGNPGIVLLLIVVCLILIWTAIGTAMSLGWMPQMNLGYQWFNTNIYPFF